MQADISSRVYDRNTDSEEFVKETYAPAQKVNYN